MAIPDHISVWGAYVNNLKHLNVDIPLNKLVAITGRSGSGKSSLAMGVLRRRHAPLHECAVHLSRRRLGQTSPAAADSVNIFQCHCAQTAACCSGNSLNSRHRN